MMVATIETNSAAAAFSNDGGSICSETPSSARRRQSAALILKSNKEELARCMKQLKTSATPRSAKAWLDNKAATSKDTKAATSKSADPPQTFFPLSPSAAVAIDPSADLSPPAAASGYINAFLEDANNVSLEVLTDASAETTDENGTAVAKDARDESNEASPPPSALEREDADNDDVVAHMAQVLSGNSIETEPNAFVDDAKNESGAFDISEILEKTLEPTKPTDETYWAFWSRTIGSFLPKNPIQCGGDEKMGDDEMLPGLVASSSSEEKDTSGKTKKKRSGWCTVDTGCGKLDIEFSRAASLEKEEEAEKEVAVSRGNKPTESPLKELLVATGLQAPVAKKDQALLTDYYQAKPKEPETEEQDKRELLSEMEQSLRSSIHDVTMTVGETIVSGMAALGFDPEENEKPQQKLMTDYSLAFPKKSQPAEGGVPHTISFETEPLQDGKSSWNLTGFMNDMNEFLPVCACEDEAPEEAMHGVTWAKDTKDPVVPESPLPLGRTPTNKLPW